MGILIYRQHANKVEGAAPNAADSTKSAPAVSAMQGSLGAQQASLRELAAQSSAPWVFKAGADGKLHRMSEGKLYIGEGKPEELASAFFSKFSMGLWGIPAESIRVSSLRPEAETTQSIWEQSIHSLPVLGSRGNLTFDHQGNLISGVFDFYSGAAPSPTPALSISDAATIAHRALLNQLPKSGGSDFPIAEVERAGRLAYRLMGESSIALVYHYVISVRAPHPNDFEIVVDANSGQIAVERSLLIN